MKRIVALIYVAVLVWFAPAAAAQAGDSPTFAFHLQADFASRYIWRGFDLTPENNPVIQPSFTFSHNPSGLWVDLWASQAVASRDETRFADELDLTLGWDRQIGEKVTISTGSILYLFPRLDEEEDFTQELFASVSFSDVFLSPSLTYYHDIKLGDGGYVEIAGSHSISDLTLAVQAGFTNRQFTSKRGLSEVVLGASYDFCFGGGKQVSPYVRFAVIDDPERNPSRSEIWFGVNLGWDR